MSESTKYIIISYCVCVFALCAFALYAVVMYTLKLRREKREQTTEEFITARRTMSKWRIAWSFFASAVGAWCITAPASYAIYTGIIGLLMYAIASGFPVLVISFWGSSITRSHPDVVSLPDYIGKRFGPVFRTMVVLISLFNMSIAMLAEYVTIGVLFKYFVGTTQVPIIVIVGVLTLLYTAYGGLYVSIITDQAQGIATVLFIGILVIYTAVTFRPESLPKPLSDATVFTDTDYELSLGPYSSGYSAIYSMPCSLLAATVFSEAMWQKVWASESRRSVIFGGCVGALLITCAVFLFGFGGFLAAWGGYIDFNTNSNLYLFQLFAKDGNAQQTEYDGELVTTFPSAKVSNWVGVIMLLLAVTMNESAIDSLQNGISAVVSAHFFKNQHIVFPRIIVVLVNIPLIVVSIYQDVTVLQLFHITNVLTSCCFIPVAIGLWPRGRRFITENCAIFGCCIAILTTTAYGIGRHWNRNGSIREGFDYGAWFVWYGDIAYSYDIFLVASGFSVVGMALWAVPAYLLHRFCGVQGVSVSDVLRPLPGFRWITGEGLPMDLLGFKATAPLARALKHDPNTFVPSEAYTGAADAPTHGKGPGSSDGSDGMDGGNQFVVDGGKQAHHDPEAGSYSPSSAADASPAVAMAK